MDKDIQIKIKKKFVNRYKSGFPLILKEAIVNNDLQKEGQIVSIVSEQGEFLGRGYYGQQNKGYGWLLTRKKNEQIDVHFIQERLEQAIHKRDVFFQDPQTTAFRIFNGEGDGFGGITIDFFDGYYLINWYSEGVYQFKEMFLQALTNIVDYKAIYQKKRFAQKGKYIEEDDFVLGKRGSFPIIVKENGVNYAVYLNEGAMVGIFLDQRNVRETIRDKYAKNKTVLNTFSYTGAFSVAAALGGATKTTSVDLANRSKPKTIEQFSVNGIDFEQHDIIVMDVFRYFKYAVRNQLEFDLVILDPPSFARSKKNTFSAAKDYKNLLKEAIAITKKGGTIIASTNASSFGMDKFKQFIDNAFKECHGKYKVVEEFRLPKDFTVKQEYAEGNYLKVVFIRKIG